MKKILLFLLCVVLVAASAGCDGFYGSAKSQVNDSLNIWYVEEEYPTLFMDYYREDEVYTWDDGSDYVFADVFNREILRCIEEYQKKYPDVKINIVSEKMKLSEFPSFYKKMTTAIMTGNGPDVLFLNDDTSRFMDVYKMQAAGAFVDLTEYMDSDPDFVREEYQMNIVELVKYNNKQYLMPSIYNLYGLLGLEKHLEANDLPTEPVELLDLYRSCAEYWENGKGNAETSIFLEPYSFLESMNLFTPPVIDCETKTTSLDDPKTKEMIELLGKIYPNDRLGKDQRLERPLDQMKSSDENIADGVCLYRNYPYNSPTSIGKLLQYGKVVSLPVLIDGKPVAKIHSMFAISNSSSNKQNAWNFIKLAISEKMNSGNENTIRMSSLDRDMTPLEVKDRWNEENAGMSYEETLEIYRESRRTVGTAFYTSKSMLNIYEKMLPYFEGTQDFEVFYTDLQNYMKIYLSE